MTSFGDRISVAVRIRPRQHEDGLDQWISGNGIIYAAQPRGQDNVFAFDHIFFPEKTNADVHENVVEPIITSVMAGYNGTLFAYGQTSSGKTLTMMGTDRDARVIRRAIAQIFNEIHEETDWEFSLCISFLEIYNEQIRDPNDEIKGPDMTVAGLTERVTPDADRILRFMTEGDKKRQLNLVNLEAGAERPIQIGATGTRLREGRHINTSLTALRLVIRKLSTAEKHINFR